ncbi:ABC transporter permease [Humibacter ginsenosidimutans]|nr:ABC transporter permease [Humibacter ginsenosidimutans]
MTTITMTPTMPADRTSGGGLGRAISDIVAMSGREIRRTLRSVDSLVTAFAIPVSIMLVFVVIFGGAIESDGDYVNYVVPGTLVLCLGFGAAATAIGVAQDVATGTVNRIKTLPVMGSAVLHGHVVASVLRNLAAAVPVIGVALLLGFRPAAGVAGWIGVVLFCVAIIVAFTWLSVLGGLLLSVDAASSINFVFLFLPYLSSGFVPVDTMPSWLHGFADHQPYTPIIETLRDLMSGTAPGANLWVALAWLAGILIVGAVGSALVFGGRVKG